MSDYDDGSDYEPDLGPRSGQTPAPPPPGMPQYSPAQVNKQEPYSVASMLTGMLALLLGLFCGLLSIPIGILAIFLGIQGRTRSRAMGRGSGVAIAGLAMGATAIVLTVAFLALAMLFGIGQS